MSERNWSLSLNHWLLKLIALLLAAVSGAALVLGFVGWLAMEPVDLIGRVQEDYNWQRLHGYLNEAGRAVFDRHAWIQSGVDKDLYERFIHWGGDVDAVEDLGYDFYYEIYSSSAGQVVESNIPANVPEEDFVYGDVNDWSIRRGNVTTMPLCDYYPSFDEFEADSTGTHRYYQTQEGQRLPELEDWVKDYEYYVVSQSSTVNPTNISQNSYHHTEAGGESYTIYRIEYGDYVNYSVTVRLTGEQEQAILGQRAGEVVLEGYLGAREHLIHNLMTFGGIGLVLSLLWLALMAGRNPRDEKTEAGGLNVLPLDLYLFAEVCGQACLVYFVALWTDEIIRNDIWGNFAGADGEYYLLAECGILAALGGAMGLFLAMFLMACAAQMKMGHNYWAKNTLVVHTWHFGWKGVKLCWTWGWKTVLFCWNWCLRVVKAVFRWIGSGFRWFGNLVETFGKQLPLTWQWLFASGLLWLLMFFCILFALNTYSVGWLFFGVLLTVLAVLYGVYCFGKLRDTAQKMSQGDLNTKIQDRFLRGCFGEFADHLNALGDVCMDAAKTQMKSERMKSELITNVSHDIKTPLTSIINYVDLLQKTDDEAERREYMEVLDRQSQKLKKLIEDLMEMSKASSGNVAVEITATDVGEAVNQALGEFADTLEACGLQVMLKQPPEALMALCDGKLLWRVLSNVLGNVVKYALPGTRVYVDVAQRADRAEISVKNISRQMLNISADELMERFVRGDSSRNTEGNGLGLNIAKSLMEVQSGELALTVDGDLFKVLLSLPKA